MKMVVRGRFELANRAGLWYYELRRGVAQLG